jgi:hypothetical protein
MLHQLKDFGLRMPHFEYIHNRRQWFRDTVGTWFVRVRIGRGGIVLHHLINVTPSFRIKIIVRVDDKVNGRRHRGVGSFVQPMHGLFDQQHAVRVDGPTGTAPSRFFVRFVEVMYVIIAAVSPVGFEHVFDEGG